MTDKIADMREAQALLDNNTFRAVLLAIRNRAHRQWEDSSAAEAAKREQLWLKIQAVAELEKEIRSTINSGKIAEQELVEAEDRRGRPRQPRA